MKTVNDNNNGNEKMSIRKVQVNKRLYDGPEEAYTL